MASELFLIKLFATDGADTSWVCLPLTGPYTSRDFCSRFDAGTGRAECFKVFANDGADRPVELGLFATDRADTSRVCLPATGL